MLARSKGLTDGAEMAHGAAVNAIALLASNLRGVFTFLVARLLGQSTLGIFALAWSNTDLLSKIGNFGLDNGVTPFIAKKHATSEPHGCRQVFRAAMAWGLATSLATCLVSVIGLGAFGDRIGQPPEAIEATRILLLALPGIALYRIGTSVSRGMRIMHHDIYSRGLTESLTTIGAFLAAFVLGLGAFAPIVAVLAGTLAGGLVAFGLARSLFEGLAGPSPKEPVSKPLLQFSAPIGLYNLLNLLIMRMDVILLGFFVGRVPGVSLATLGVFSAAVDIAGGMRKVRQTFDPIFAPVVATQSVLADHVSMQRSFAQLGRWVLAVQLPMLGVLALSGGLILSIFGPGFDRGAPWLVLLAIAHGTNTFVGLAETVIMVHHPVINLVNSAVTAALQLGTSLLLIPRLGATGAAVAMVAAYSTQGILRLAELRVLFGWRLSLRPYARPVWAAIVALAPGLALRAAVPGALGELFAGLLFTGLYLGTWWTLGLEAADRVVLDELRKRRGERRERR
jgi:O-antigen/teichoic acid export membrane protein